MATYDNRHWLLSHVRNSFISTDDTGMCELVMVAEDLPRLLRASAPQGPGPGPPDSEPSEQIISELDCYPEMEASDDDDNLDPLAESYDLQHDMDFSIHRQRSNTAQRLEKMEHAQKKAAKIKVIKWEGPNNNLSEQDRDTLFAKKDLTSYRTANKERPKRKSLLSDQLEKCPHLPQSQYLEFAMYDGAAQFGLPIKVYKIFMTMLPEELRNYPISVCVIANAKIRDLIGFTCYKYSIEHPEIVLLSVSCYNLYICEDDGEVDFDLPYLDIHEPCSKYGFTCLGLVDTKSNSIIKPADIQTCSIPEKGGFNAIVISENSKPDVQIKPVPYESKDSSKNLDKKNENKTARSLNRVNSSVTFREPKITSHFDSNSAPIVGTNEPSRLRSSNIQDMEAFNRMKIHELSIEAPLYQSFRVQVINKVRSNTHVYLGISGEKIEIDPIVNNFNLFWPRMKSVSYSMDSIAYCEMLEAKSSRATFRVYYSSSHGRISFNADSGSSNSQYSGSNNSSSAYKHFNFECDHATAKEIVDKLNMILQLKSSTCRKEFLASKDKKSHAKKKSMN